MGDSSDNIPGVKGVGVKTATRLLKRYGTVEEVYKHLDEVTSTRFRNALERGREEAFLSQHLATIVRDLDVPLDLDAAEWGNMDREQVMELMRRLGFRSLMERIPGAVQDAPAQLSMFSEVTEVEQPPAEGDEESAYCVVDTPTKLQELVDLLREAKLLAVDTETTATDAMRDQLVGTIESFFDRVQSAVDGMEGNFVTAPSTPELPETTPVPEAAEDTHQIAVA